MSFKTLAADLLKKHLNDYLDIRYEEATKEQCKKVFDSPELSSYMKHPNAKLLNEFIAELWLTVSKEVYAECRDSVHVTISKEIDFIIENLFDEEESKQIYEFCKSDVGRKLLRNMDMIREAYASGIMDLTIKTIQAWQQPEVGLAIAAYMDTLNLENDGEDGVDGE